MMGLARILGSEIKRARERGQGIKAVGPLGPVPWVPAGKRMQTLPVSCYDEPQVYLDGPK